MTIDTTDRGLELAHMYAGPADPPEGTEILGLVTRDTGEIGALLVFRSGYYVQYNAGVIRTLDQHEVKMILQG